MTDLSYRFRECPACCSVDIYMGHLGDHHEVYCSSCWTNGPKTDGEDEATARWNAMPRGGIPVWSCKVDGHQVTCIFTRFGRLVTASLFIEDDGKDGKGSAFGAGARCHPGDEFDLSLGMRLAMKRACGAGIGWNKHPAVYSAFRRWQREELAAAKTKTAADAELGAAQPGG